jgi:hypothetical protein
MLKQSFHIVFLLCLCLIAKAQTDTLASKRGTPSPVYFSAGNVGIATSTPTSTLHVIGSQAGTFTRTTVALTLTAAHRYVVVAAGVPITLPAANTCTGRLYTINARVGGVTISSYIGLNGNASTTVGNNSSIEIISDGTLWQQVK